MKKLNYRINSKGKKIFRHSERKEALKKGCFGQSSGQKADTLKQKKRKNEK